MRLARWTTGGGQRFQTPAVIVPESRVKEKGDWSNNHNPACDFATGAMIIGPVPFFTLFFALGKGHEGVRNL